MRYSRQMQGTISKMADRLLEQMLGLTYARRKELPEYAEVKALRQQAHDWAAKQEIIVAL